MVTDTRSSTPGTPAPSAESLCISGRVGDCPAFPEESHGGDATAVTESSVGTAHVRQIRLMSDYAINSVPSGSPVSHSDGGESSPRTRCC